MLPKKTERMLIRHPQPNRAQYVKQDFLKKVKVLSKEYPALKDIHLGPNLDIDDLFMK